MNEFTKQELEDLLEWGTKCLLRLGINDNPGLLDKLESLIDNYCEFKIPTMKNYCCNICNEEWWQCECESKA